MTKPIVSGITCEEKYKEALERILAWDEHSLELAVNRGSNGVRDYYRTVAKEALAHTGREWCCGASRASNGWHHDTGCENFGMVY